MLSHMEISYYNWWKLIRGLRQRGGGIRESGAFLLCRPEKAKVCKVVFYDQFDENVSDTGIIQFRGGSKFHKYLSDSKLSVLADIHTHPSNNTNQSISDQENPMIRIKGHIAIIAPNYALNKFLNPCLCSIYKYKGEFKWSTIPKVEHPIKLTII